MQATAHGAADGDSAHVDVDGAVKEPSCMRSPIVGTPPFSNLEHRHWLPIVPLTVDRGLVIQVERRPEEKERRREDDRQNPSPGVDPQKEKRERDSLPPCCRIAD